MMKNHVNNFYLYRPVLFVTMLILFMFSALRYQMGTDYEGYRRIFNIYLLDNNYRWNLFEPGFYHLINLTQIFTDNYQFFIATTSFFTLFFIYKALKEQSIFMFFSLLLYVEMYFYFNSFNLVRQYMAIAVCFYALRYVVRRGHFLKYFSFVLLAASFHITAVVMLVVYPFLRLKINYQTLLFYSFIVVISLFLYDFIAYFIAWIIPKYSIYLPVGKGGSANWLILFVILTLFTSFILRNRLVKASPYSSIYINGLFLSLPFLIIAYDNIIFFRISFFFVIYLIVLIPLCVYVLRRDINYFFSISFVTCIALIYFTSNLFNNTGDILPLNFYF
jgi:transmembrane protein EpsG